MSLSPRLTRKVLNGVDDRQRRQEARHDREQDRRAHVERSHEGERERRPCHSTEVVHHPLESVSTTVCLGRNGIGKQRVASGDAEPASGPSPCTKEADLPRGCRNPNASRQDCRSRVATNRNVASPLRIVCEPSANEAGDTSQAIRQSLDKPEHDCGRAERLGKETWQKRGCHLVAQVGEEARGPDPSNAFG